MRVTYNWLKDFVAIKLKPEVLADKLTMSGLEVVSLLPRGSDFVFEIEITSNRPDWLSVIGIAREVAAITNQRLRIPRHKSISQGKRPQGLSLKIADLRDCPLYTAKIIRGVKVGPSPEWLKARLELLGCRSVNNVVDITNYVLFEYGEPLHAFDLGKLVSSAIVVRRAHRDEKILTLDGSSRALDCDTLVISDNEKAVAIAGIIGGKDTEVTHNTKGILLEAAVFNPVLVRRTRQRLGVQTESAYRFERGVDPQMVGMASSRATELIQKISGGNLVAHAVSGRAKASRKTIVLDVPRVGRILGLNIGSAKIKGILTRLEFKVKRNTKDKFSVEVPSLRSDVQGEIDLIEELARIYGYGRIPPTLPRVTPQIHLNKTRDRISFIKGILLGLGLNEVITYSLVDPVTLRAKEGQAQGNAIEISNPLSKEQAVLRPELIPSLTRCVAYNLNQRQAAVNIFEIASVFRSSPGGNGVKEEMMLGIALCGIKSHLSGQGLVTEEQGLLHLKGIIETLFLRLGIKDYAFGAYQDPLGASVYIRGQEAGTVQMLPHAMLEELDIKNKEAITAELSLEKVFSAAQVGKQFIPLPKYPFIIRDASFIIKEDVPIAGLIEELRREAGPLLSQIQVVDYYKGKQIPAGFKGLTLSCFYLSQERTLTEDEINPRHAAILTALTERFGARLR